MAEQHERREHDRYELLAQVRVKRGKINYLLEVRNVSASGAFIAIDDLRAMPWFRVDQELDMDIFAVEELDNLRIRGRVVRVVEPGGSSPAGVGVQFGPMDEATRAILNQLVDHAEATSIHPPPLPPWSGGQQQGNQ